MLRAAERCEGNYQAIVKRVQQERLDRAGRNGLAHWRVAGVAARGGERRCRGVRGRPAARRGSVGAAASAKTTPGTLIHDGYASYDRFWRATHQTCLAHLLRRCKETAGDGDSAGR